MGEKEKEHIQKPISLLKLVTLGVTSSILVVGGLFLLFAAYESQTWLFWTAEEHLDPDTLFGVGRNAVTLAAALGVGVTLFFSYRKQQTAERAQELADKAQTMALDSQRIATETLQLSLEKHDLERVGALRDRYSRSAEQIASDKTAVQLAGIHSLAALADDWAVLEKDDEQQVCIALLCSYIALTGSVDSNPAVFTTTTTAVNIAMARLALNAQHPEKFWGNRQISIEHANIRAFPKEVTLCGGNLDFIGCAAPPLSTFHKLQIDSGNLSFVQATGDLTIPSFEKGSFNGGMVLLHGPKQPGSEFIQFKDCIFDGATVVIFPEREEGVSLVFENCTFTTGRVTAVLYVGHYKVEFKECTFNSPNAVVVDRIYADAVDAIFKNCQFVGDAAAMEMDPAASVLSAPKKQRGNGNVASANKP